MCSDWECLLPALTNPAAFALLGSPQRTLRAVALDRGTFKSLAFELGELPR
jgi:hypothetical protein